MVSTSQTVLPWLDRTAQSGSPAQAIKSTETKDKGFHPFGQDGISFLDLIDVVNPLHHIPVIGPIYRNITGDVIDVLPRITGSTLFFGPIGAGLAAADVVLEESTGRDTGEHILAMLRDLAPAQTAAATPSQTDSSESSDPINAWLHAEALYHKQYTEANEPNATTPKPEKPALLPTNPAAGSVLAWAQAESAYRAGLAARQSASTASKLPQPEYRRSRDLAFAAQAPRAKKPQELPEFPAVHRSESATNPDGAELHGGRPLDAMLRGLVPSGDHNTRAHSRGDRAAAN